MKRSLWQDKIILAADSNNPLATYGIDYWLVNTKAPSDA